MHRLGDYFVTEPVSTTVATGGAAKILAMLFGSATLAAFVVMITMQPRTRSEWATSLICTVLSSISGGSCVVMWMGLQHWANEFFGLMALFGLVFVCGLPGWVIVRWGFAWVHAHPGKNPFLIVREIREAIERDLHK